MTKKNTNLAFGKQVVGLLQERLYLCHSERSEESRRFFATLRMTILATALKQVAGLMRLPQSCFEPNNLGVRLKSLSKDF